MRRSALTVSVLSLVTGLLSTTPSHARVSFDFDYSYDTNGFFNPSTPNGQAARATLNAAADYYSDRFLDTLTAITPDGSNTWRQILTNPGDGSSLTIDPAGAISTNTVKVYAGGYDLPGATLGIGGFGGYGASGFQPFFDTLKARGQAGGLTTPATDFGPWGGAITFDTQTTWNFSIAAGPTSSSQNDFLSVALHELGHMMGVGTAPSFTALTSALTFTGPKAEAAYGGVVPLGNSGHLGSINSTVTGTDVQQVAMSPSIVTGTRKYLTVLDWATLDDLGWDLAKPGDADANASVDFSDLLTLAKNYGTSGKTWSEGDFNYDHTVDFTDLLTLAKNYGTSGVQAADIVAAGASPSFANDWTLAESLVPEPTSFALVGIIAVGLLGRRRVAR